MATHKHQIVIIGGGNAGISVAAKLLRKNKFLDIAIIDGAKKHFYQPAFTLVAGGVYDFNDTVRNEEDVMLDEVTWIQQMVAEINPEKNLVITENGDEISYEFLIVAPGLKLAWDLVKGLPETIGKNNVCSIYSPDTVIHARETIENFSGGTALFTNPATPIKCGGAPQKIMYLSADKFRKKGLKADVQFWTSGTVIFGVKKIGKALTEIVNEYGITVHYRHHLVEVRGNEKIAVFESLENSEKTEVKFDLLHVTPPQQAPDFIRRSPVANQEGWVDVDINTLQHNKYKNIFSLGDAAALPTAKTGAAIRKQAPVLVNNLLAVMKGKEPYAKYYGYSSCPLIVGYGRLVLAEFDYNNIPQDSFPFEQARPRWSMWMLKTEVLPWLYWNQILKGEI